MLCTHNKSSLVPCAFWTPVATASSPNSLAMLCQLLPAELGQTTSVTNVVCVDAGFYPTQIVWFTTGTAFMCAYKPGMHMQLGALEFCHRAQFAEMVAIMAIDMCSA